MCHHAAGTVVLEEREAKALLASIYSDARASCDERGAATWQFAPPMTTRGPATSKYDEFKLIGERLDARGRQWSAPRRGWPTHAPPAGDLDSVQIVAHK